MTAASIILTIASLLAGWIIHNQNRYVAYLEAMAGRRNLWNVRCSACLRRLRDAPVTSYHNAGPVAGSEIISHFHSAPRICAELGRKRIERRETPDA